MKMHVVYDPNADRPRCVEITAATVNDVEIGREVEIEAGATYVFDRGYYHFGWWKKINDANARFVTRTKGNTRFRATKHRYVRKIIGDTASGSSTTPRWCSASKGDSRLSIPLRRIRVRRDNGGLITLITNDLERTAVEIAALYRPAGKSNCCSAGSSSIFILRKFLGTNENAIRLQSSPP